MKFEKGNNLGGRTKGATNKSNKEVKEMFKQLLENNLPDVQRQLDCMKAPEKFHALMTLAKFVIPQMKAIDHTIEIDNFQPITIILNNEDNNDKLD